jgi:hypothetical protein
VKADLLGHSLILINRPPYVGFAFLDFHEFDATINLASQSATAVHKRQDAITKTWRSVYEVTSIGRGVRLYIPILTNSAQAALLSNAVLSFDPDIERSPFPNAFGDPEFCIFGVFT